MRLWKMLPRYENHLNTISSAEYDQNWYEKNVSLQVCIEHLFVNTACINKLNNLQTYVKSNHFLSLPVLQEVCPQYF